MCAGNDIRRVKDCITIICSMRPFHVTQAHQPLEGHVIPDPQSHPYQEFLMNRVLQHGSKEDPNTAKKKQSSYSLVYSSTDDNAAGCATS